MKLLFLGLLLANLLAFLAHAVFPGEAVQPSRPSPGGDLKLVSEDTSYTRMRAPVATAGSCYFIGPVRDLRAAARYQQELAAKGFQAELKEQENLEPLGYWVYIPPAKSLEAAQVTARRLAERGVTEYVFVVGAEKANAISLGLYNDKSEADARVEQLEYLGFSPRLERRFTRVTSAVIVLQLSAGETPEALDRYEWQIADCQAYRD